MRPKPSYTVEEIADLCRDKNLTEQEIALLAGVVRHENNRYNNSQLQEIKRHIETAYYGNGHL